MQKLNKKTGGGREGKEEQASDTGQRLWERFVRPIF